MGWWWVHTQMRWWRRHRAGEKRRVYAWWDTQGHVHMTTHFKPVTQLQVFINSKWLHWSMTRWGGQKERERERGRCGGGLNTIMTQELSHNKPTPWQLAQITNYKSGIGASRSGRKAWERQERWVDPTVLLWISIEVFPLRHLSALYHFSTSSQRSCPFVNLENKTYYIILLLCHIAVESSFCLRLLSFIISQLPYVCIYMYIMSTSQFPKGTKVFILKGSSQVEIHICNNPPTFSFQTDQRNSLNINYTKPITPAVSSFWN